MREAGGSTHRRTSCGGKGALWARVLAVTAASWRTVSCSAPGNTTSEKSRFTYGCGVHVSA